jgi:hypothetical protein
MANKKVGTKTSKSTQVGRDVYETSDGEMVSEKSTTFQYKGKWINIPTIHNGYQYDDDTLRMMLKEGIIEPTSVHEDESSAVKAARERSDNLKFSKGGTPMRKQMKLFNDGGLKEEGGMVDEESGNAVPVGGTRKGVRDDIPAMVSEGEFVFPEDVVRYIGLDKLMQMRQKAKTGLQNMDDMGQMGNSEEATVPDNAPLSPPVGMAEGGVVQQTAAPRQLTTAPVQTQRRKVGFKELMGKNSVEFKEFRNAAGGKLLIPFVGGKAIYPIPSGYTLYDPSADAGSADTNETQVIAQEVSSAINAATGNDNDSNVSLSLENTGMPKSEFQKAGGWDMDTSGADGKSLQTWITEATKFTNGTSTVVAGVASLFGMGLPVALMNASQKKRVLKEIDDKIAQAKKTSMPGQVAALQKIKEELSKKASTSILGKVVEGINGYIGDLFGADEEEKKTAATEVVKIENETFNFGDVEGQYSKSPSLSTDLPGELSEPEFTSTANMAGDIAKDGEVYQRDFDILTRTYNEALTEVQNGTKSKEELDSLLKFAEEKLGPDGAREIKSNSRPLSAYYSQDGSYVPAATLEPTFGQPKLSTEEQIAKRASITPSSGVPFSASADPRLLEAAGYQEDFGAGVPETRFTAPLADASKPLEDYVAPSTQPLMSIKNVPEFIQRAGEETRSILYDTPISALQAQELGYSTEQPIRPKSPFENVPRYNPDSLQAASEGAQGNYVPIPTLPNAIDGPFAGFPSASESSVPSSPRNSTDTAYDYGTQMDTSLFPTTVQDQTKEVFNLDTPTPSVDTSSLAGISAASGPDAFDPRNLGGAEGYGQTGVAPTTDTKTFKETFAEQRKAGAKEFSYDRDGDGKTERYTTDLAKPAEATTSTKAGSNSLYQAAANLFTPGDDKEYVDGKLVDKVTNKVIEKRTSKNTSASVDKGSVATSNVVNKTGTTVVKEDQSRYGDAGKGNVWAVQPGTNAVTKVSVSAVKDSGSTTTSTTTTTRSKEEVQAEINKSYKENGGWTPEVDKLVKEREAAVPTNNNNKKDNDNDNDSGGGGGGDSTHCCTAAEKRGDMTLTEVKKLRAWHRSKDVFWQEGYDVWGKIVADHLVAKYQWSSDRVRDFYYHKIYGKLTIGSVFADIVIYPMSYAIGIYLHAVNKLTSIKFFKET